MRPSSLERVHLGAFRDDLTFDAGISKVQHASGLPSHLILLVVKSEYVTRGHVGGPHVVFKAVLLDIPRMLLV